MFLYFNCYIIGEGYSLRRISKGNEGYGALEPIRLKDLPAQLDSCFVQGDAELCLNCMEGTWYGCVRNIPTFLQDEARRSCFLNLAVTAEPGNTKEEEALRALMAFARDNKDAFTAYMSRVIYYPSMEYAIDTKALDAFIAIAITEKGKTASPFTIEEGKWSTNAPDRNVYFYCSTPSMGYVLRKIEPTSGVAFRFGTKKGMTAASQLLPLERKLLDNGGADMALFEQNGRCCFIVKGVKGPGESGQNAKKLCFLMDVPVSEEAWLTRMASWALFSPELFSRMLTASVEVYSDLRGFRVLPENLAVFFAAFDHAATLPDSVDSDAKKLWKQINSSQQKAAFRIVALETTCDYFEKQCETSVAGKGTILISYQQAKKLAEEGIEIIIDDGEATRIADSDKSEQTKILRASEEKNCDAESSSSTDNQELQTEEPEDNEDEPEDNEDKRESEVEIPEEQDIHLEEERIDLLDYKWFLPSVIAALLLIVGVIIMLFLFKNNQGGLP